MQIRKLNVLGHLQCTHQNTKVVNVSLNVRRLFKYNVYIEEKLAGLQLTLAAKCPRCPRTLRKCGSRLISCIRFLSFIIMLPSIVLEDDCKHIWTHCRSVSQLVPKSGNDKLIPQIRSKIVILHVLNKTISYKCFITWPFIKERDHFPVAHGWENVFSLY